MTRSVTSRSESPAQPADTVLPQSAQDLERSWGGCYLGLRTSGGVTPVFCEQVRDSGTPELVLLNRDTSSRVPFNHPDIVYKYPDFGFVKLDELYWLEREPRRQWHKGVRTNLVTVHKQNSRSVRLDQLPRERILELLHSVYNSQKVEAIEHQGFWWYRGAKICETGKLDELPEHLQYIKRLIEK